jgi:hypothetical protein
MIINNRFNVVCAATNAAQAAFNTAVLRDGLTVEAGFRKATELYIQIMEAAGFTVSFEEEEDRLVLSTPQRWRVMRG